MLTAATQRRKSTIGKKTARSRSPAVTNPRERATGPEAAAPCERGGAGDERGCREAAVEERQSLAVDAELPCDIAARHGYLPDQRVDCNRAERCSSGEDRPGEQEASTGRDPEQTVVAMGLPQLAGERPEKGQKQHPGNGDQVRTDRHLDLPSAVAVKRLDFPGGAVASTPKDAVCTPAASRTTNARPGESADTFRTSHAAPPDPDSRASGHRVQSQRQNPIRRQIANVGALIKRPASWFAQYSVRPI
jgi:hypothetical protein